MFNGDRVSVWEDERVLETDVVTAAQQCEWTQYPGTVCLKVLKMVGFTCK